MLKRFFLLFLFLILINKTVIACINDFECGMGKKCIQPENAINSMQGICVTPTEEGVPQPYVPDGSATPHQVPGCSFDIDCDPGFSCLKRTGELEGVCVR